MRQVRPPFRIGTCPGGGGTSALSKLMGVEQHISEMTNEK
jgi:enoyl-CoA hydratase/carnithine racemase